MIPVSENTYLHPLQCQARPGQGKCWPSWEPVVLARVLCSTLCWPGTWGGSRWGVGGGMISVGMAATVIRIQTIVLIPIIYPNLGVCSNLVTVVKLGFQWIPLDIGVLNQNIKTKKHKCWKFSVGPFNDLKTF